MHPGSGDEGSAALPGLQPFWGCSPNQNRSCAGVPGSGRVIYFALYWCPVHGIQKAIEAVQRGEATLR